MTSSSTRVRKAVSLALMCGACAVSGRVSAQKSPSAEPAGIDDLRLGYALKKKGQCVEAIARFDAALRREESAKAYLNKADCHEMLAQYALAYLAWTRGLALAEKERNEELTVIARNHVQVVSSHVAIVTLRAAEGVRIQQSGQRLESGEHPFEGGTYVFEGIAVGHKPSRLEVTLKAGERRDLQIIQGPLEVETNRAPIFAPPPRTASATDDSPWRWVGLSTAIVGAAGLAVGTGLALSAKSSYDTVATVHCVGGPCDAEGLAGTNAARSQAHVATGLFVGSLVLSAVGWTLFFLRPGSHVKPAADTQAVGRTMLAANRF